MSMTIVVTRNASGRMRGFLASSMLELAPGVYSGARLSVAVRERIWAVVEDWFPVEKEASVLMVWDDPALPGGQMARWLGSPPLDLVECDGMVLTRRDLPNEKPHANIDNSKAKATTKTSV